MKISCKFKNIRQVKNGSSSVLVVSRPVMKKKADLHPFIKNS